MPILTSSESVPAIAANSGPHIGNSVAHALVS